MSEETVQNSALENMERTLTKYGPAYLIMHAAKLYGSQAGELTMKEDERATELTQFAFDVWGINGALEYASKSLLVDASIIEKLIAEQNDIRTLLNGVLLVRGVNPEEAFKGFYEYNKSHESDMPLSLEDSAFRFIDVVPHVNVDKLAAWVLDNGYVNLALPLLTVTRVDILLRMPLIELIGGQGTWTQRARLCMAMPNAVTKSIREKVMHNSVDEEMEIKEYASSLYLQADGDVLGLANAIKIINNQDFTTQMEHLARSTSIKLLQEAGGVDVLVGDQLPTKLATAVKNASATLH